MSEGPQAPKSRVHSVLLWFLPQYEYRLSMTPVTLALEKAQLRTVGGGGVRGHNHQEQPQSVLSLLQAQERHGVGSELKWRFPNELTGKQDSVDWGWILMQSPYFLFPI